MFVAYFDASGTPNDGNSLTVAGYVSDAEKWTKFEGRWLELLARENLQAFHMTDFASSKQKYSGWDRPRRKRLMTDLVECVRRFTRKGFGSTVVLKDYNRADLTHEFHETLGYPYAMCAWSCIEAVVLWADKHGIRKGGFVFEDGDKHKGDLQGICRMRGLAPEPTFGSKGDFIPLQAADLAAWKVRYPIRKVLDPKLTYSEGWKLVFEPDRFTRTAYSSGVFDKESLRRMQREMSVPRRP